MNHRHPPGFLHTRLSRRRLLSLLAATGAGTALLACSGGDDEERIGTGTSGANGGGAEPASSSANASGAAGSARPAGWTEASHGNDVPPDYGTVFPAGRVNQLTFVVSPENWQAMLDDMTELLGQRGTGGGTGRSPNSTPVPRSQVARNAFGTIENPIWVPATVRFSGLEWTNVGFRFKGNSSLRSGWREDTDRMPFKLDFDEFEDEYPEIDNQRFYGFKQISLSNNWRDESNFREALTYDLFAEAGLAVAETGFYDVTLDYGEGPRNLGVYTFIEVVDDTVVPRHFEDDSGNIYEGEGPAASFAEGSRDQLKHDFQAETDDADWTDLEALYDVLHSPLRTGDSTAWQRELEAAFDVDGFLKWLALSTLLGHWDSYGGLAHNFYLYNDPSTGRLHWITWDHNLVLGAGNRPDASGRPGRVGAGRNQAFDKSNVGSNWPLISFLIAVPEYKQRYDAHLRASLDGVFKLSGIQERVRAYADLLAPYARMPEAEYAAAVDWVIESARQRIEEAEAYLANA